MIVLQGFPEKKNRLKTDRERENAPDARGLRAGATRYVRVHVVGAF